MDFRKILQEDAARHRDKAAVVFKEKTISFAELQSGVFRLAGALSRLGVKKSDKVAVYLPNSPEYIESYLACFCLGAVVVPLDYMLKSDELGSCLGHSEAKFLIACPKNDVSLAELKTQIPSLQQIIITAGESEGAVAYREIVRKAYDRLPEVSIADNEPALIMYTSGTTGRPKGILLNYKHLEGSPKAMEHFVDLSDRDVKLCALPLSHIAGLIYIQNCVIFGITLVLMDRFNSYEFLRNVQQHKITCFHIVPAMYTAFLSLKQIDQFDLSSLRWVVVFGAPNSPDIMERFHRYCPNAQLLNGWGMTETCPPNTVTPFGSDNIASIGKPSPFSLIKIVDDNGKALPAGEIGEILISGWVVMEGYYKDPDATSQMKRDGWLYTGDLGRYDKDGFLYIMGRKKKMIKVAGQIVYAPEVEAALHKHEAVAEAAVIGVPDALRGEAVKAFVVLKTPGVSSEDLRYFAREHLAHFKVPQAIEIREALPKNRTGKVDKEALKQAVLT
ncbi:MAG: AMP-binding protein [Candidatus Omnitrophota bacterium]|nr:AMP-binding protein [Candidatus Omnitrophota bacterium]